MDDDGVHNNINPQQSYYPSNNHRSHHRRIPKRNSPLVFTKSKMADFSNNVLGWSNLEVCGAATFAYCDTLMPETYCTQGVPNGANVVLNMIYKPYMWGGALGGSCEFDERNRPISIGYWMHVSLREKLIDLNGHPNRDYYFVGISTHEINHGLGFNIGQFLKANVVSLEDVFTEPMDKGTKEDSLWHFKKDTRVAQLARVHYNCWDDDAWHGVPLMGAVEGGRDSHQNSFVMLEDVESYGPDFNLNTPFTLAALEDTGHYLANYSKSDFPNWGAYQGCEFITTRCRVRGGSEYNNLYEVTGGDNDQVG